MGTAFTSLSVVCRPRAPHRDGMCSTPVQAPARSETPCRHTEAAVCEALAAANRIRSARCAPRSSCTGRACAVCSAATPTAPSPACCQPNSPVPPRAQRKKRTARQKCDNRARAHNIGGDRPVDRPRRNRVDRMGEDGGRVIAHPRRDTDRLAQ